MNSTFIGHQRIHSELRSESYLFTSTYLFLQRAADFKGITVTFAGEEYVAISQVKITNYRIVQDGNEL